MVELLCAAVLGAMYFGALLLPAGAILLRRAGSELPDEAVPASALLLGALFYASVLAVLRGFGAEPGVAGWALRGIAFAALFAAVNGGDLRRLLSSRARPGLIAWQLAYLFAIVTAAFPGARISDVRPDTIGWMSQLAVDNFIPYNVARYFVEGIPFGAVDVVPDWSFTERGPLAGMLTAVMMLVLGVSDNGHWLSAKPGVYFSAEAFLVWLNAFSVYAVWLLSSVFFGRRAGACAMLLLSSTYFFWVNVYFTWPKLFAGALFLLGLLFFVRRLPVFGGLFLGAAFLAHDSVVFALVAFAFYGALKFGKLRRELARAGAAFAAVCAPWALFKIYSGGGSGRLLANHLFCFHDPERMSLGFLSAVREYFAVNGIGGAILVRLENIAYPFNFFHAAGAYVEHWRSPLTLAASVSHLTFYQLLYAVGIPGCVLGFMGFFRGAEFRWAAAVGFGSLFIAGLAIACPLMTVNHAWAYPLFLLFAVAAGGEAAKGGAAACVLFGAAFANNVLFFALSFYFGEARFVGVRAEGAYLGAQAAAFAILLGVLVRTLIRSTDETTIIPASA